MMDYGAMLEAVRAWVEGLAGETIQMGIPETDPGIYLEVNAAGVLDTYFDRRERRDITLTLYVKHASKLIAATKCSEIGLLMTRATEYPFGDDWTILTMQAGGSLPVYQEASTGLWLYVNNVEVTIYC